MLMKVTSLILGICFLAGVSHAWWDNQYQYRRMVWVTEQNAENITTYAVSVSFDHQAWCNSEKSEETGYDIRIVDEDDATQVARCLDPESGWDQSDTEIWFPVTVTASEVDTYYMYYGYAGAGDPGYDEDNVFDFWDDFPGTSLAADWEGETGSFGVGNSICSTTVSEAVIWNQHTITDGAMEAMVRTNIVNMGDGRGNLYARFDSTGQPVSSSAPGYRLRARIESNDDIYLQEHNGFSVQTEDIYSSAGMNTGNWYRLKLALDGDSISGFLDGTARVGFTDATYSTGQIAICSHNNDDFDWDWILVRDFVDTEPSVALQSEEEAPAASQVIIIGYLPWQHFWGIGVH